MIESISLINKTTNDELKLDMITTPHYILKSCSWGQITATHNTTQYANQIGVSLDSTVLGTRQVDIIGYIIADTEDLMSQRKKFLNRFVNPTQEIQLVYQGYKINIQPTNTIAYTQEMQENNEVITKFQISAVAFDPLFYDKDSKVVNVFDVKSLFKFPFKIPGELKIKKQPQSVRVESGTQNTFSIEVTGAINPTYLWQISANNGKTWTDVHAQGQTNSLALTLTYPFNNYQYRCKVTDEDGSVVISNAALVKIIGAIEIIKQPVSLDSALGNVVMFTITATVSETTTLSYQWQISNDSGVTWKDSGRDDAKTKTMQFAIPREDYDGKMFRCKVTDGRGISVISEVATLTLNGEQNVTITSQSGDISIVAESTVNLYVRAKTKTNSELAYQWQVSSSGGANWGNTSLAGNTNSSMSLVVPANYNGRMFRCMVIDAAGNWALSKPITLTVTPKG